MQQSESFLYHYRQNNKLAIRLISPTFGHLDPGLVTGYGLTHRKTHYFFIFMIRGRTTHGVDLRQFEITNNELLFIFPHQIHELPTSKSDSDFYKIGFDEHCLSLLPKQFPFLINPLNQQKIRFSPDAAARVKSLFGILQNLLTDIDTAPDLLLAHLNSLLTEFNSAYFSTEKSPADDRLTTYIRFKLSHACRHSRRYTLSRKIYGSA